MAVSHQTRAMCVIGACQGWTAGFQMAPCSSCEEPILFAFCPGIMPAGQQWVERWQLCSTHTPWRL